MAECALPEAKLARERTTFTLLCSNRIAATEQFDSAGQGRLPRPFRLSSVEGQTGAGVDTGTVAVMGGNNSLVALHGDPRVTDGS
jgi:hypothetical protein